MNRPMDFIHLTSDKLIELGSLCSVSDGSDKTFTDPDLNVIEMIPCLEHPALKHVILCVEKDGAYRVTTYHNVRMTNDIWDSSTLISKSFDKTDINDEPDEYADDKVIGQRWLEMILVRWSRTGKVGQLTMYVRPSISTPGHIDILLSQEGTEFIRNQLTGPGTSKSNVYEYIFYTFVNYIVVNQVLLSNGGKYLKTGSKISKSSALSMTKRTLPGKVSLKNIGIDVDAFIADHPLKKHDEASDDAVKIWHCPAWEVRGHYRHYKSGKVTYVKPHTKGKLRDTLVVGREYDLDTNVRSHSENSSTDK